MSVARRGMLGMLVTLVVASPSLTISQARYETFRLASDSPLATDGTSIFGVATDGRSILVSSGTGSDWRVLTKRTANRVTGLAWDRGALYFSEEQAKAIYRIRLDAPAGQLIAGRSAADGRVELFHQGTLRTPRGLAISGGVLVADPQANAIVRVDLLTRQAELFATSFPPGEIEVAGDDRLVAATSAQSGEVRQTIGLSRGGPVDFLVWKTRQSQPAVEGLTAAVVQRRFQRIESPSAPVMANGSLYLVDDADGAVYVNYRQQARAIPVVPFTSVKRPRRLLAVGDSLMVLDAARGLLDRWPLPVPTQFELGHNPERAIDALYQYFYERRLLPVRSVPWRTSLEETLRQEGVVREAPGPGLLAAICGLNAGRCETSASGQTWTAARSDILIPNVPIESGLDLETLRADELGDGTLGEKVDELITSKAFFESRGGAELWELNASRLVALDTTRSRQPNKESWGPYDHDRIRQLRRRSFPPGFALTVPVEKVRAFAAIPLMLLDRERLAAIRLVSPGFDWNPLEDGTPKAQGAPVTPATAAPAPCDLSVLAEQIKKLRETVTFEVPPGVFSPVNVAVVDESLVDEYHTAFGPDFNALTFLPPRVAPAPLAKPYGPPECDGTESARADHATAVASLIAGRAAGLEGLAHHVRIVSLNGRDDLIGTPLAAAFRNQVPIFNLSVHYNEKLPTNLREKVNSLLGALFVVSAGNDITDDKAICESRTPYPLIRSARAIATTSWSWRPRAWTERPSSNGRKTRRRRGRTGTTSWSTLPRLARASTPRLATTVTSRCAARRSPRRSSRRLPLCSSPRASRTHG